MKILLHSSLIRFLVFQLLAALLVLGILPQLADLSGNNPSTSIVDSLHNSRTQIRGTPTPVSISLWRAQEKKVIKINLEDYVAGVVAGEMPSAFDPEALKAQAVAARTYALSRTIRANAGGNPSQHPSAPLCDETHCQVFRSCSDLKTLKSEEWIKTEWPKILQAVRDTEGQVLYYNDQLVEQPLFHASSGGRTENSEDVFVTAVPYLRSVESKYEADAPHKSDSRTFSISDFSAACQRAFGAENITPNTISIVSRSEGGRVTVMQVGTKKVPGRQIRDLFGLNSANFTIAISNSTITFTTTGSGHGVGMSQWGANGMAKAHYTYLEILSHYYKGTTVKIY